jgi:hypothetical protein
VEAPGRSGLVVLGLEVAGASSCQWKTRVAAAVSAVVEVAGMEADGCWKMEVQLLEAAGKGSHRWEMVQAAGAEEMGARRVQPEGAASWVRVQPEKGAASVAGGG